MAIFERLRRRGKGIAGIAIAAAAFAWAGPSAAWCSGMLDDDPPGRMALHQHGDSIAKQSPRNHSATPQQAPHAAHQHAPCPHCFSDPAGSTDAAAHAGCAAAGAVLDTPQRAKGDPSPGFAAAPLGFVGSPATADPPPRAREHVPRGVPRALNVRYCVFLN